MNTPSTPRADRDAILDALQDQIDDLTVAMAAQQKLIDAHSAVIVELARLAGLGAPGQDRPDVIRHPAVPAPPAHTQGGRDG